MENSSQISKIVTFLKSHPNQRFTAREIADALIVQYPEFYTLKRQNSCQKFVSDADFINQIVAEIASQTARIIKNHPIIEIQNQPRPRKYWFSSDQQDTVLTLSEQDLVDQEEEELQSKTEIRSEKDMYPLLR